jgi:hypothetical protein
MKKFLSILSIFTASAFISSMALASINFPKNLTKSDREESLRVLGFGTATKVLSDPFPLGGYSGIEVGVSVSDIPVETLKNLGNRLGSGQSDVSYAGFSIGKGLYNNLDVFFNFTPYFQSAQISQFGAQIRWSFYQADTLPLSLSVVGHASSSNFGNQITERNLGADLIGGINVSSVALFAGLGQLTSTGDFLGGTRGLTDSGAEENESVTGTHYLVGISVKLTDFFISAEVDQYAQPIFSAKLGLRL